jgi:hypothetical protein
VEDKRVPTQFLDLKSQDFGPKQEDPGSRISKVGKPPPTKLIEIHPERVRKNDEVLAALDRTPPTFSENGRRWAKHAMSICLATWDSAMRAVRNVNGSSVGRAVTLEHDVELHARAEDQSPVTLSIPSGVSIVIYPEIDAPSGWIAARAPSGELGYVAAENVLV